MSACCWLPKPKYEPFITHNRGTLMLCVLYLTSKKIIRQFDMIHSNHLQIKWTMHFVAISIQPDLFTCLFFSPFYIYLCTFWTLCISIIEQAVAALNLLKNTENYKDHCWYFRASHCKSRYIQNTLKKN